MDTEHGNSITHTGKQILSSGILFSESGEENSTHQISLLSRAE
jgi:hypothetical protein